MLNTELYGDQLDGLEMLWHSLKTGHKRPMLQAPTGYGKTKLIAAVADKCLSHDRRFMVTVPAIELVDQTLESLYEEGIKDVGVIQAAHPKSDWGMPVQVCSVQTLERRELPAFDIAGVDEAHRWFKFFAKWFASTEKPIVGFSATPWTKGLGKHYDDLLIPVTLQELIEVGRLCDFRVFAPSSPDLTGVRTLAGDYHEGDLSDVMSQRGLVADVVETWITKGEQRPTLCFCVDRAHAKKMQAQFEARGVKAGYVDAFTKKEDRKQIREASMRGDIDVVCNVACLTTGVDWPWISCIIGARPTKSEMLFVQMFGRGLRLNEGKPDLLYLDHSDNHIRLGFVTDIRHDTLSTGRKGEFKRVVEEALPKPCPSCKFMKLPKIATCPKCGFKPQRQSDVKCDQGELEELFRHPDPRPVRQRWYSQFLWHARQRGWSEGWAAHAYKRRYKTWPPRDFHKIAVPMTVEATAYVKSLAIRYAKGKAKGQHHATA